MYIVEHNADLKMCLHSRHCAVTLHDLCKLQNIDLCFAASLLRGSHLNFLSEPWKEGTAGIVEASRNLIFYYVGNK